MGKGAACAPLAVFEHPSFAMNAVVTVVVAVLVMDVVRVVSADADAVEDTEVVMVVVCVVGQLLHRNLHFSEMSKPNAISSHLNPNLKN